MQIHTSLHFFRNSCSDKQLAQLILSGEQDAFEELVQRYSPSLFNFIYRILRDYDQACDVLQNVFLRLYLSFSSLKLDRPLKPWLFQVAHHCCIDEIRQSKRNATSFSQLELEVGNDEELSVYNLPDSALPVEEIAIYHEIQAILQLAIDTLPPAYRSIVLLRYAAQLRFAEIANIMDIPEATVKTYFHRAKGKLRQMLEQRNTYRKEEMLSL